MKSILLVGDQNPYKDNPDEAFDPLSPSGNGQQLMRILGLSAEDYLLRHDRVNLCRGAWDRSEGLRNAANLLIERPQFSGIILLGRKVEDVFGFVYPRYEVRVVEGSTGRRFHMLAMPHPNVVNREWNSSWNVDRARSAYTLLRRAVGLTVDPSHEGEPSVN